MTNRFIVMTASESMPSSCKGRYGKVAVVELEPGFEGRPAMISERAKGVARIVTLDRRLNVGGARSAFALAHIEAQKLCAKLNAREQRRRDRFEAVAAELAFDPDAEARAVNELRSAFGLPRIPFGHR